MSHVKHWTRQVLAIDFQTGIFCALPASRACDLSPNIAPVKRLPRFFVPFAVPSNSRILGSSHFFLEACPLAFFWLGLRHTEKLWQASSSIVHIVAGGLGQPVPSAQVAVPFQGIPFQ